MSVDTIAANVVYTVDEVATMLRCSPSSVYRLVATGRIHSFTIGDKGVRVSAQALDRYINGTVQR